MVAAYGHGGSALTGDPEIQGLPDDIGEPLCPGQSSNGETAIIDPGPRIDCCTEVGGGGIVCHEVA